MHCTKLVALDALVYLSLYVQPLSPACQLHSRNVFGGYSVLVATLSVATLAVATLSCWLPCYWLPCHWLPCLAGYPVIGYPVLLATLS